MLGPARYQAATLDHCSDIMLEKIPSIVGEALKAVRPGLEKTSAVAAFADVPETIAVESTAFGHGAPMPATFSEDGRKVSPPLTWTNVPQAASSVALMIEDADSPTPDPLVHAIVVGLPAGPGGVTEGALKSPGGPGQSLAMGKNSFMKAEYLPPDPPSGHGPHRYVFQIFALDRALDLGSVPGRAEVIKAMTGHVLAKGMLIGTYERV